MSFKPIYKKVLIKPFEKPNKTEGGLYIPDQAKEKPTHAQVIEAADDCEFVKIGDIVTYGKYAGTPIDLETKSGDKETLLIIQEKDILAFSRQNEESEDEVKA